MFDDRPAGQRTPDANAHAREVLRTDVREKRLDTVMTARTSLAPQTDRPRRDVHVVVHDDQILRRELVPIEQRAYRASALIHIGQRLDKQHLLRADVPFGCKRVELLTPSIDTKSFSQGVDKHKSDIVLRTCILRPRISEAGNDLHRIPPNVLLCAVAKHRDKLPTLILPHEMRLVKKPRQTYRASRPPLFLDTPTALCLSIQSRPS